MSRNVHSKIDFPLGSRPTRPTWAHHARLRPHRTPDSRTATRTSAYPHAALSATVLMAASAQSSARVDIHWVAAYSCRSSSTHRIAAQTSSSHRSTSMGRPFLARNLTMMILAASYSRQAPENARNEIDVSLSNSRSPTSVCQRSLPTIL